MHWAKLRLLTTSISLTFLPLGVGLASDAPVAYDVSAEVFENRITPIYLRGSSDATKKLEFVIDTLPQSGTLSDKVDVLDSPNIALFLYTNVLPGATSDKFTYSVKDSDGVSSKSATVEIKIIDVGLRWDLFAAGTTSVSETVNVFNNANFLFRLDWLIKEPWRKGPASVVPAVEKMMKPYIAKGKILAPDPAKSNALNRGLNARFTFETGVIAVPVTDETTKVLDETTKPPDGRTTPEADAEESDSDEESQPVQSTRNAFTFGGEFIGSFVGHAGDGRSLFEIGGGGRASYKVLFREDQLVQKDGVTFLNLSDINRETGFGVYEVFGRFRLTQFEDNRNEAYDVGKLRKKGELHLVHPRNMEDLIVVEVGLQRNEGLKPSSGMIEGMGGMKTMNRWYVRLSATPEIPNSGHTKALLGVEVNNDRGDGLRNVRVFYGVNVALNRLFRRD